MNRKQQSMENRQDCVMKIAATNYHSNDDAAMDYLATIEGANLEEQKQLFRLIITTHGARQIKDHKCPSDQSIEPKEWRSIKKRLGDMVKGWSQAAVRNNDSPADTASMLWDELTLCEGKDRVVALGLLLDMFAVPYAQLPGNLTLMKPLDVYDEAHDRILDKIAILHRVKESENLSILELAVAMAKLIEQMDRHEERVAFIAYFLRKARRMLMRSDLTEILGGFIGGSLLGPFHLGSEDNSEESDD